MEKKEENSKFRFLVELTGKYVAEGQKENVLDL